MDDDFSTRLRAISEREHRRLVEIRRSLHVHPEVGWAEHRTHDLVAAALGEMGMEPFLDHKTALAYDVHVGGAQEPRTPIVALRADMDALPIVDQKAVDYRSTVPGVCHACGHDAHTAILIGVARVVIQMAEQFPPGVVRLIFQPAEERMPGGGQYLTALGVMRDVHMIFGLHCDPSLPVGTVGVRAGPISWGCDTIHIGLSGPGGHTARPELTNDLVRLAARIVLELPDAMASKARTAQRPRLVFGVLQAGSAPNSLPRTAQLSGTIRMATKAEWDLMPTWVKEAVKELSVPTGISVELDIGRGSPPVENDPEATELLATAARRTLGSAAVQTVSASLGADDFAWYLNHAPGSYCRLGVRPPHVGSFPDLHTGQFDLDEGAMGVGLRVLVQAAFESLEQREAAPSCDS